MTDTQPVRVLIVDDDADAREWLAEWLRHNHQFQVETASNNASAQERAVNAAGNFDAALIDLELNEDQNGLDALKFIHTAYPDIGVILITGFGDVETGVRAMQAGALGYVGKSLNLDEVLVYIRAAAERRRIKRERDQLQTERDWLEILTHVSQALNVATLDLRTLANAVHRETIHLIPHTEVFYLALYDADADELTFELANEEGVPQHIAPRKLTGAPDTWGLTGWIVKKKEPLQINDILTETLPAPSFTFGRRDKRAHSYLGFPLISRNQVVGVISAQCFEPSAFKPAHRQFLQAVANQAATVIDNARLHKATQDTDAELKLLLETTTAVASAPLVDAGLETLAEKMVTGLGVTFCHIMLRNGQTQTFQIKAAFPNHNAGDSAVQWQPTAGKSVDMPQMTPLAGMTRPCCFRAGEPVHGIDVVEHFKQQTHFAGTLASLLVIPLSVGEQLLGICTLGESNAWEHSPFAEKRIALAESLAKQAIGLIDRFRAHEATERKLAEVRRLGEITEALVQSVTDSPQEILDKVARATGEIVGAQSVVIYALAQNKRFYSDVAHYGLQKELPFSRKVRNGGLRARVRRDGIIIVDDVARGKDRHAPIELPSKPDSLITQEGIQAFVGIALQAGAEQLGVMFVNFAQAHFFTEDEIEIITRLANQAAVAIQKSGFIQHVREEASDLRQGLWKITCQIFTTQPLDEILRAVAQGVKQVLGCDLVTIHLYDDEQQRFPSLAASAGELFSHPAKDNRTLVQTSPIFQHLLDDPAAHFAELVARDPVMRVSNFARKEKIRSCAAIVLRAKEHPLGFLFANYRSPHHFSPNEQAALEILANQAATFIDNARSYDEMKRQSEHRQALYDAGKAIVQGGFAGDSKQVLDQITSLSVEHIIGMEGPKPTVGIIQLYDSETNTLSFESVYPPERLPEMKRTIGERRTLNRALAPDGKIGITGCAVEEKKPQRVSNVSTHPDYIPATADTQAELAVPLLDSERVIGVLSVESDQVGAFDLKDEQALQGLGDLAVVAIKSARQSEALSRTNVLAVLGAMGADIAHTVNRQVGYIRRAAFLARDHPNLPAEVGDQLAAIDQYASEMGLLELPENQPMPGQRLEFRDAAPLDATLEREINYFRARERSITFLTDFQAQHERIAMHANFLQQLLRHLIKNAVRHIPADKPVRRVIVRSQIKDALAHIQVEDSGTGVRSELEPLLFRQRTPHIEKELRHGRGLLLVRFIAEQHGGKAKFEWSRENEGACFSFSVPLARATETTDI